LIWQNPNFITREDVGIAYRKAKADLFYERGHVNAFALSEYEDNLSPNLEALYQHLQLNSLEWMTSQTFCGDWSVISKAIGNDGIHEKSEWHPSDPDTIWRLHVEKLKRKKLRPTAEFRVVGIHSVDFHVISALWLMKVGHVYDSALGPQAYGSRLRRLHRPDLLTGIHSINPRSLGSFKHYLEPYRQWRDRGLHAIKSAVHAGKRVVAITADVRQFYHRLSPEFLLDERYIRALGVWDQLDGDMQAFTNSLLEAISAWCSRTPLHQANPRIGVPVGLPASRLIANVALADVDRTILAELSPLYYGRYVDDIMLVFEDTKGFTNERDVWKYIEERTAILQVQPEEAGGGLRLRPDYLPQSQIIFTGSKQKIFVLEGTSGSTLIETIERQVRSRTSEWRSLPHIPENEDILAADLLCALEADGEEVDNLRKADTLSARRASFALRIRDVEAFEQDLPRGSWGKQRKAFLRVVRENLIALPQVFTFITYLPRIFGLAIASRDYDEAILLIKRLLVVLELLKKDCRISLSGSDDTTLKDREIISTWRNNLTYLFCEALVAALKPEHLSDRHELREVLQELSSLGDSPVTDVKLSFEWARSFFFQDLGRTPFRVMYFPNEERFLWRAKKGSQIPSAALPSEFVDREIFSGISSFLIALTSEKKFRRRVPLALLFPTRPFSVQELYLLVPETLRNQNKNRISEWALAFRGFYPTGNLPGGDSEDQFLIVPSRSHGKNVRIAVTSWKTDFESWKASVVQLPDPDLKRYSRLNRLLNDVMRAGERPRYVVLPELSIPSRWFVRFARKLAQADISLISGVEYIHHNQNNVANQVWASLVSDFLGIPSLVIYRQDKTRAGLHEESDLHNIGGRSLLPLSAIEWKPIVEHGEFLFGILICSELTNIEYRQKLRGNVDALFVPEWNKDFDTFSILVESCALDIHAYIVQCNDRQYGDSRIRAPMKNSWDRDIVRVRGGMEDYFVVGEIDPNSLRRFHSLHRSSSDGPFKPVPDGFIVHNKRRKLP